MESITIHTSRMEARQKALQAKRDDMAVKCLTCEIHQDQFLGLSNALNLVEYEHCPKCQTEKWAERHGISKLLAHSTFENYVSFANEIKTAKAFAAKKKGLLIFHGNPGTGKDHLAVAIAKEFRNPRIIKQSTLLRMLRATYRDENAADPVDMCCIADLLVLEEVGLSAGGKDEFPMLHDILDYRHGNFLPIVMTMNLPMRGEASLADIIGDRMADRFKQSGFEMIHFTGTSKREEQKQYYI